MDMTPVADDRAKIQEWPEHLVSLQPDQWAVWKWFALRGAGFPLDLLAGFSDRDCAAAADSILGAEDALNRVYGEAISSVNRALDLLKQSNSETAKRSFKLLAGALRALRACKTPRDSEGFIDFHGLFESIRKAEQDRQSRSLAYQRVFSKALERQSAILKEIARNTLFREAVVWQNMEAFESAVEPVAKQGVEGSRQGKKGRQHEELVATYLQRYCAKNDTIGFFGPVAWGTVVPGGERLKSVAEKSPARRRTYFEEWAIDSIGETISLLPDMRQWIAPRLAPHLYVERDLLHLFGAQPMRLDILTETVLANCDGEKLPADIVFAVRQNRLFQTIAETEINELLRTLAERGVLIWRFTVPVATNPETCLRRQLLGIRDATARARALAVLAEIEACRDRVDASAGRVDQLNSALREMDMTFRKITGKKGQRNRGATYAGRTLVYEDCLRGLRIQISKELIDPILPALLLLLRSLRWYTQSIILAFQDILQATYAELASTRACKDVPASALWLKMQQKILTGHIQPVAEVEELFIRKWSSILRLPPAVRSVGFESRLLKQSVEELFPEISGMHHAVRYYCPDLMLAAVDAESVRQGDLLYVLGELHLAANTLSSGLFVEQHPDPQELVRATQWDFPKRRFNLINSRHWPNVTTRTNIGLVCPGDFLVAASVDAVPPEGKSAVSIGSLIVREQDGQLRVMTRDVRHSFHILEAFADPLCGFIMNKAKWMPPARHTPRVLIDRLVIQRETWLATVDELVFAFAKEGHERFLGARRWRRERGMPPVLFVKSPAERKPFYVDLESPVYTEHLCKMVRRLDALQGVGAEVVLSEMLPGAEHAWLEDFSGKRFTSELRFVIMDVQARSRGL